MSNTIKEDISTPRRKFLKKAVYSPPVLSLLGSLVLPVDSMADSSGGPVGPPGGGSPYGTSSTTTSSKRSTLRF